MNQISLWRHNTSVCVFSKEKQTFIFDEDDEVYYEYKKGDNGNFSLPWGDFECKDPEIKKIDYDDIDLFCPVKENPFMILFRKTYTTINSKVKYYVYFLDPECEDPYSMKPCPIKIK